MPYEPKWLTLAEAVEQIRLTGEAAPLESLRRACADDNVSARGMVDGDYKTLGPEWWHPEASVNVDAGTITKGPTSQSVPKRAISRRGGRLTPDDYKRIPLRGNGAEAVEVAAADIQRIWTHITNKDGFPIGFGAVPLDPDLSNWSLVDAMTVEQAACLWARVDPSRGSFLRTEEEKSRIAPYLQLLSGAIQSSQLQADCSTSPTLLGDYSKCLVTRDALITLACFKDERPAFLFDTLMPAASGDGPPSKPEQAAKSKGGRPREYDWDAVVVEIIRVANSPDGLPDTQAALVAQLLQWCENEWGKQPAESSMKERVSRIYNALGLGRKPLGAAPQ